MTCPIKVWANCPARHKQTMQRRRYSSTMKMDPLAECCSFTAHNPQQSQLKQQFSSYIPHAAGCSDLGKQQHEAAPLCRVLIPFRGPGAVHSAARFYWHGAWSPGHVRSGGSDGARVELWTPWWSGRWSHPSGEVVTGGNLGIICLQDQAQVCVCVVFQSSYLLNTIFFLVTDN